MDGNTFASTRTVLNNATGEINGTITSILAHTSFTVVASNAAGLTQTNLTFHVHYIPTGILTYPSMFYAFTKGEEIPVQNPTVEGGGIITSWTVSPTLPDGLSLNSSGVITGIPTNLTPCQEYLVNASNPSGSSHFALTICVNDVLPPSDLNYPSVLNIFTVNTSISPLIPTVQGDNVNQFTAQPLCPMD